MAAKYAPGVTLETIAQADKRIEGAFREYDPQGLLDLEDREKIVLMRHYIGDSHARAQTTFAMMLSENNERLAGGEIGGEMTPYYRLSQTIPAYRRPISTQEGLEYSPPPQTASVASYVEGRTRIARPETVDGVGEAGGALAAGEGANADASLVSTAAAWGSEQLRLYQVSARIIYVGKYQSCMV